MYSDKVMELFRKPHNMGEIRDADGIGKVGNPRCGDLMEIYIKVERRGEKEIIKDIKVKTFGCVAALATSSMLTDIVKGKTLEDAERVSNKQIADSLGGLPPIKMHCSVLAADALNDAIRDYREKKAVQGR